MNVLYAGTRVAIDADWPEFWAGIIEVAAELEAQGATAGVLARARWRASPVDGTRQVQLLAAVPTSRTGA